MALLTIVPRHVLGGPKFTRLRATSSPKASSAWAASARAATTSPATRTAGWWLSATSTATTSKARVDAGTEEVSARRWKSYQRLPPPDRRPQCRHRAYRHAAALARHHGRRGRQGRQGHLVRETDDAHHRRGQARSWKPSSATTASSASTRGSASRIPSMVWARRSSRSRS